MKLYVVEQACFDKQPFCCIYISVWYIASFAFSTYHNLFVINFIKHQERLSQLTKTDAAPLI